MFGPMSIKSMSSSTNRAFFYIFLTLILNFRGYTRESVSKDTIKIGIHDKDYPAKLWLYILMGVLDAMWQTTAYWLMGAMSNDVAKLAHFIGFCKAFSNRYIVFIAKYVLF